MRPRIRSGAAALGTAVLASVLLSATPAAAISGGTVVPAGTHPFLARISTATKACSGVLVAPSWVLTAAACLSANPAGAPTEAATVAVGKVNVGTGAGVVSKVTKVVRRADRDVVLAKLADVATGVTPITVSATAPQVSETLQVAGFGRTATEWIPDRPRVAPFTVSAVEGSQASVSSADGVDTCKGDAGGPAFRVTGSSVELVALSSTSWQHGCLGEHGTDQGGTTARVDDLRVWIRQQTTPTPVSCPAGATVWAARSDGRLWKYTHKAPADGAFNWVTPTVSDGGGWTGRTLAGPGGVLWDFHNNNGSGDPFSDGILKRWVRTSTGWTGGDKVGTGWARYLTPQFSNRITVDQAGRIFAIDEHGQLRLYVWDDTTGTWANGTGTVVATQWAKYDSITAAGDGVIYAREANGNLSRYQYDYATNTWPQLDKPVGHGWNNFTEIFSPGGDILYGRGDKDENNRAVLRWYRYHDTTDEWEAPTVVGSGWDSEIHVTAVPDSCKLIP